MNLPENLHKIQIVNPKTNLKLIQEVKAEHSFAFSDSDMSFLYLESAADTADQKRRSSRILQKDAEAVRTKLEQRRKKLIAKFKNLGVPISPEEESSEPEAHQVAKARFKPSASRRLTMKPTQRLEHTPDSTEIPTKEEAPTTPNKKFELATPPLTYSLRAKQKRAAETSSSSSDDDVDNHSSATTRKSKDLLAPPAETESVAKPSHKIPKTHENNARTKVQQTATKSIPKANSYISPINDVPSPTPVSAPSAVQPRQSRPKPPVGHLVAVPDTKKQAANEATGVSSNQRHASSKDVADSSIGMASDQLSKISPEILSASNESTIDYYSSKFNSYASSAKGTDPKDSGLKEPLANMNKSEEPTQLEEHSLKFSYLTPQEKQMSFGEYIRKLTQDHIQYLEEIKKLKLGQLDDLLAQFDLEQGP
ncbi:hypothetical protein DSO57_1028752 [Entomophthora muscae]|uniref:Uncharacterized protein n=1 Tax=Entomophthora muscae TaxID=34485 RepID=A0ACC2RSG6_9FUNG|nr:hypothetical protein DSO57_1028752 [Entomophthora muscae]